MNRPGNVRNGLALLLGFLAPLTGLAAPAFEDTLQISPLIITSSDPTTYLRVRSLGTGRGTMFDLRVGTGGSFVDYDAFLFEASFGSTSGAPEQQIEFQVNPEFGASSAAQAAVEKFAQVIGQVPIALRVRIATVSIHKGVERFVGQSGNLVIHADRGSLLDAQGLLEEVIVHEAAHIALDVHLRARGWLDARATDPDFISRYASSAPDIEDVAESFVAYLAARNRPERILSGPAALIERTIPNRLRYFESLGLDLFPVQPGTILLPPTAIRVEATGTRVTIAWERPASGLAPTAYELQAGSAAGLSDLATVRTPTSQTALTFDGVPPGTYYLRLRSIGPGGLIVSSPDVVVNAGCGRAVPFAPVQLSASVSNSQVNLTWDIDSSSPIASAYLIEVGSATHLVDLGVFRVAGGLRRVTADAGPGRYFVRMRSVGDCGVSTASTELVVTVP